MMRPFYSVGLLLLWAGAAGAATRYRVTDLGTLGGALSRAHAVNERGHVVGESENGQGQLRAFFWSAHGGMAELGTLGGDVSRAYDVNDKDIVVGESETAAGLSRPFRWKAELGLTALGLPPECAAGYAEGLNHFGTIVGAGDTRDGSVALLWTVDQVRPVAPTNRLSVAHDVNDEGWVAGQMDEGASVNGFLLFGDATTSGLIRVAADELAGCAALAVNPGGTAAGYTVSPEGLTRAALMTPDGRIENIDRLDSAYSMANGINAAGAVVGSFIAGDGEDEHAFLYEGGEFHDLNDLIAEQGDWILVEARDINERGQVVGYGLRNGEERAVLLTPEPESEERLPAVRIVEPEQGSAFAETDAITLLAEASADAGMRRVVFYANGQAIGAANEPPFTWTWTGAPPGDCDLLAVATDSGGRMRRSARVRIMVGSVEADEAPSGDEATASGLDPSSYTPSAEPADESPALRAGVPR